MDHGELAPIDLGSGDRNERQTRSPQPVEDGSDTLTPLGMPGPGVMEQGRRMARNYNVHLLTLAQVPNLLRVDGSWPGPISLRAGWFRATARPWNETVPDPMVRLERGGSEFLIAVSRRLFELGAGSVFSPALYGSAGGVWRRSGFGDYADLDVMERSLSGATRPNGTALVRAEANPDWDQILAVDRAAFEGFWGMSRLGLIEAHRTNRSGTMLVAEALNGAAGYAIVGSQWGTVYLHRIAVHPDHAGQGIGGALLASAVEWGNRSGGGSMVLNVRPENTRARQLYERHGFSNTGTRLHVLRRQPD